MSESARPYRPLAFANEFIGKAIGIGVEHMKLQKLVYYTYGWWLAFNQESIINEAPEVWKHGPVFPSLYASLRGNGSRPIQEMQKSIYFQPAPRLDDGDSGACQLSDWIWEKYGKFDSFYLSDLSHEKGSPWNEVAESFDFRVPYHTQIPDEITKAYFKGLAKELKV